MGDGVLDDDDEEDVSGREVAGGGVGGVGGVLVISWSCCSSRTRWWWKYSKYLVYLRQVWMFGCQLPQMHWREWSGSGSREQVNGPPLSISPNGKSRSAQKSKWFYPSDNWINDTHFQTEKLTNSHADSLLVPQLPTTTTARTTRTHTHSHSEPSLMATHRLLWIIGCCFCPW